MFTHIIKTQIKVCKLVFFTSQKFRLKEKYEISREVLKCDYIRYSPSEINTINTPNSKTYNNLPRGGSVNSLFGSLSRLIFCVLHAATNNRYVDGIDRRLDKLEVLLLCLVLINWQLVQVNTLKKLVMHILFVS